MAEHDRDSTDPSSGGRPEPAPPSTHPTSLSDDHLEEQRRPVEGDPKLPRYELRERLGEGSTAVVYAGWDPELRRPVAVKVLRASGGLSEIVRQRFRREAQATARMAHPNVVAVHDVGEHEGKLYLVMERVEGKTLNDMLQLGRSDRRGAVALIEKAARGVAAAHALGIVHRDLKPGNILITRSGEPKVTDFGLAHVPDATQALTRSGAILGTPLYMAPEQVEGKDVSPATDVYALGAILYELLVGRPPHQAERVTQLYRKIVRDDPEAPRKLVPDLPVDLETVVLKALDHAPSRRYADAGAFAADLRKHLDGMPIDASRQSRVLRWFRYVGRRRAAVALGLTAVAWAAVLAVGWRMSRAKEGQLLKERQEALEMMRETARLSVDAALRLRRAGDAEGMKRLLPRLEAAYARASGLSPSSAEVDYLMGRMHRALMKDQRALEYQARALEKDPDYAPGLYEQIILKARAYDFQYRAATENLRAMRMNRIIGTQGRSPPLPSADEIVRAYPHLRDLRESILADCGRLRALMQTARREEAAAWIGDAHMSAADGILAYGQQRYAEGRARLESAVGREPLMEEAWEALTRVLESQEAEAESGSEKQALRREAQRVYSEAIAVDAGYLPFRLGRGNTTFRSAVVAFRSGKDPLADLAAAEKDFEQCVRIDPDHAEAWQRLASVRLDRGRQLVNRGLDPSADWAKAEEDLDQALRLRPDFFMTWCKRGFLRTLRGSHALGAGEDPRELLTESEKDLAEAVRLQSLDTDPWLRSGILWTYKGLYRKNRDEDPLADWAVAESKLGQVLRMAPGYSEALMRRGVLRFYRGQYRASRKEDPEPDWKEAEADFTQSLSSEDLYVECRTFRALVRTQVGLRRLRESRDPSAEWDRAEEDFRLATREGTAFAAAHEGLGDLWWSRAQLLEGRNQPAKEAYAECAREYAEAVKINPRLGAALEGKAKDARRRAGR